jgi:hypothetical protein
MAILALHSAASVAAALAEWSSLAEQRTSYTTDAFQFSSARRLRFSEDPSQPTVVPTKHTDDVIWEPSLQIMQRASNALGENVLSFKAHGAIYTNNPIFNHGDYRIQDRQWIGPDTSVLLRYRYVPNLFLGPNLERRSSTRSIQEERVSSHHLRAEVERRLNSAVTATVIGRYGLRLYNAAFAERDTQFYTAGPRMEFRVTSWMIATLSYLYERGLADGHEEVQFRDDVSYYLHMISLGTTVRISAHLDLDLSYVHLRKSFTSGLIGDTHLGRFDKTDQGTAELRYYITRTVTGLVSFQHGQRTSTNALRNFNDSIVSIGMQYQL